MLSNIAPQDSPALNRVKLPPITIPQPTQPIVKYPGYGRNPRFLPIGNLGDAGDRGDVPLRNGPSYMHAQYVGTRPEGGVPTDTGNSDPVLGHGPEIWAGPGYVWRSPGVKTPGGPGPSTSTGGGTQRTEGGGPVGGPGEPTTTEPPGDVAGTGSGNGSPSDPTQSTDPVTAALLAMLLQQQGGYGGSALAPGVQNTGNVSTGPSNPIVIIFLVIAVVGGFYLWHKYKGKIIQKEGA